MEKYTRGKWCCYALPYTLADVAEGPFMVNQLRGVLEVFLCHNTSEHEQTGSPIHENVARGIKRAVRTWLSAL